MVRFIVIGASIALVAYLALVPLGFLLWQSVHAPASDADTARLTLDNFRAAYASRETARLFYLQFPAPTTGSTGTVPHHDSPRKGAV